MEEILNIDYHRKILIVKALNKTRNLKQASALLGVSERALFDLRKNYNVVLDEKRQKFYIPERVKQNYFKMKKLLPLLIALFFAKVCHSQIKPGYVSIITNGEKMTILYPLSKSNTVQPFGKYAIGFFIPAASQNNDSMKNGGVLLRFDMDFTIDAKNDHNQCVISELFIQIRKYNASLEYIEKERIQHFKNVANKRYLLDNIIFYIEKEALKSGVSYHPYIQWLGNNYFELQ